MNNQLRRSRAASAGFTLVELLVVVIIIGIIASIATLGYSGARKTSMVNACKIDWATANSALSAYRSDYPADTIANTSLYTSTGTLIANSYMTALINNSTSYTIILNADNSISVKKSNGTTLTPADSSACTHI
jgi:hypothetical protein